MLLDNLPNDWNGYPIDTDFRTGIQIMQCLQDEEFEEQERMIQALSMLFYDEENRPDVTDAVEGLTWYLNEYNHDKHKKSNEKIKSFDFDVDQWRIYSAFRQQYGINLNIAHLHWFEFMGMLSNLEECAFTRVIDIRTQKIDPKATAKQRKAICEAKSIYALGKAEEITPEQKQKEAEALEVFNKLRNKNNQP